MIAEWSAAAAAAAFVILTAGVLIALRVAMKRLARLEAAALELQQELKELASQAKRAAEPAEQTIRAAQRGLEAAGSFIESIDHIGAALGHTASSARSLSAVIASSAERYAARSESKQQADPFIEWVELGVAAWTLWQSGRKQTAVDAEDDERMVHTK